MIPNEELNDVALPGQNRKWGNLMAIPCLLNQDQFPGLLVCPVQCWPTLPPEYTVLSPRSLLWLILFLPVILTHLHLTFVSVWLKSYQCSKFTFQMLICFLILNQKCHLCFVCWWILSTQYCVPCTMYIYIYVLNEFCQWHLAGTLYVVGVYAGSAIE